jgi:thymidylate synthase (FAD)
VNLNELQPKPSWEKGTQKKVLDHGYVKLVNFMGGDEDIIESARMSTGKGFISWDAYEECQSCGSVKMHQDERDCGCPNPKPLLKPDGDQGLLHFMFREGHSSPFEQCELIIEVQAPIFVFREWHRHRTQSYNEFSARYSQMPNLHYLPEQNRLVMQSKTNKQGSSVEEISLESKLQILADLAQQQEHVYETYDEWVENGLAKEVARLNTPVSRYSKMRAKANLLNWLRFLNLRMRPTAQWEIRQFADQVGSIIDQLFPRTYFLFEEWWLYATTFGRSETNVLKEFINAVLKTGTQELSVIAEQYGMKPKEYKALLSKLR